MALLVTAGAAQAQQPAAPTSLRIVGGLAGVNQFNQFEEPFWRDRITVLSKGQITATVLPFDRSGLRGQDMLQLIRLGVVPFGTAILGVVATDDPELNAPDLPGLSPDMPTLRRTMKAYRAHLEAVLRDRYDTTLLGVYAYPAQVMYCTQPFASMKELAGRKIRVSSVSMGEMVGAFGAVPIILPFAETVKAVTQQVVSCAVTGTLSGHEIGLSEVTTHIHPMALGWGLSIFAANTAAFKALPEEHQAILRAGIAALETEIWNSSERDTTIGLDCNIGQGPCPSGRTGRMTLVKPTPQDEDLRRKAIAEVVLARWIERCGGACERAWSATIGPALNLPLPASTSRPPASGAPKQALP